MNTFPSRYKATLDYRESTNDYALRLQMLDVNEKPMDDPYAVYEWKKKPLDATVRKALWLALRGIDIYTKSVRAKTPALEEVLCTILPVNPE